MIARDPSRRRADVTQALMSWIASGALALNLLLILGLVALIGAKGLGHFWADPVELFELEDGTKLLGQIREREADPRGPAAAAGPRLRIGVGNRDVTGNDFVWVAERDIAQRSTPPDAILLERTEWGPFYGFARELRDGDEVLAQGNERVWDVLPGLLERKHEQQERIEELEDDRIDAVNRAMAEVRLERRRLEMQGDVAPAEAADLEARQAELEARYQSLATELERLRERHRAETLGVVTASGRERSVKVAEIVRAIRPNQLGLSGRIGLYVSRLGEFLLDDPRESNTEGGIFPAIFGTLMMVFLTSLAVMPLGVLSAIYLREYAREGPFVSMVRIAVNSLAGVPSIVFGVFGLGFFVYIVGGTLDQLFYPEALPTPTYGTGGILWASLTLALLTVPVVIVSTEEGLAAVPRGVREGSMAVGATRFETLRRIVLPSALPGVLTGLILAMARAAGEVAPLMVVGMVKLAPTLPVDGYFPYVHLERKFMHLGFHIYDVGFQSPNVEAVQPLVFATALLLILVVLVTNLSAILLRNHLRRLHPTAAV